MGRRMGKDIDKKVRMEKCPHCGNAVYVGEDGGVAICPIAGMTASFSPDPNYKFERRDE